MKVYEVNVAAYAYESGTPAGDVIPVASFLAEAVVHRGLNLSGGQMLERLPLVLKLKKAASDELSDDEAGTHQEERIVQLTEQEMGWVRQFLDLRGVWGGALMELAVRISSAEAKEATLQVVEK